MCCHGEATPSCTATTHLLLMRWKKQMSQDLLVDMLVDCLAHTHKGETHSLLFEIHVFWLQSLYTAFLGLHKSNSQPWKILGVYTVNKLVKRFPISLILTILLVNGLQCQAGICQVAHARVDGKVYMHCLKFYCQNAAIQAQSGARSILLFYLYSW